MDEPSERRPNPDDPKGVLDTAHLQSGMGRRVATGTAWSLSSHAVHFLFEAVRIAVLARLLVPEDYGLVAMATVIIGLAAALQDLGLNIATVTREDVTHTKISALFWINIAFGVALALGIAALSRPIAWFYDDARLVDVTLALAPTFLLNALSIQHQAVLRRQMRFAALTGVRLASNVTGILVGIALAWRGAGYWALVSIPLVTAGTNAALVWRASRWRPGAFRFESGTGELVAFGARVTGGNMVNHLATNLDQILLGWWWGAAPLGFYTRASTLVNVPIRRVVTPVSSVVLSSLSRLVGDPERYRAAYLRVLEKLALVFMPGSVLLACTSEELVPLILGAGWEPVAPLVALLAVVAFVRPLDATSNWLFITQDRADERLTWSLAAALMTGLAAVAGVRFGALGVACGIAAAALVRVPLLLWVLTRRGPLRVADFLGTLAAPCIASAGALAALLAIEPTLAALDTGIRVAAATGVAAGVVLGILVVMPRGRAALRDVVATVRLLVGPTSAP